MGSSKVRGKCPFCKVSTEVTITPMGRSAFVTCDECGRDQEVGCSAKKLKKIVTEQ